MSAVRFYRPLSDIVRAR